MSDLRDFYAALVEWSDDAIVSKDIDGIVIGWNPAAERLFGWTAEEMLGQSIRRLLPPDRGTEEDDILARIRAGERVGQFYTRRLHKSGRLLDVAVAVSPVRDAAGRIIGASKNARDIGAQLESERRLRDSEERFRRLAETISQFVWIADAEGRPAWYNRQFYDYTGVEEGDLGEHLRERLLHPDEAEQVLERFAEAVRTGGLFEDTFRLRGRDGTYRWYLSRGRPVHDEDGRVAWWFGTHTDITEAREQGEQIRLLLLEVNHRAKNLLASVQALARRSGPDDPGFIERFESRLHSLSVNQDILVRREWRDVPVEELVRAQLAFVDSTRGGIDVAGPRCALVPRAAEVIGMALHELATNALKYGALSVPEGRVAISWKCTADRFTIEWRERGGPPAVAPATAGFGTTLTRDVPSRALDAEVTLEYPPEGLIWTLSAPLDVLASLPPG